MLEKYILDDNGEPVAVEDVLVWASWLEEAGEARRCIGRTLFPDQRAMVSTVFLGVDVAFGNGPPLLFESMLFEGSLTGTEQRRYTTRAAAEAGHLEMVSDYVAKMSALSGQPVKMVANMHSPPLLIDFGEG